MAPGELAARSAEAAPHLRSRARGVVSLKIAILGTRGVPPRYGGFETFAAELGTRLVARGHEVTVYCRDGGEGAVWLGIRRIVLPAIRHKYLETVSHTFLSALNALRRDFDVILLCNAANAFVLPLLRAARLPVAINVDGIERRRRKWNLLGRAWYAIGESFAVRFANRIIADAEVIARYYRERYGADPVTIAYGADFPPESDSDVLQRLRLRAQNYILYVSRFEPENNPLEVVLAYEKLDKAPPLVMVGAGLYAKDLVAELQRHASDRILFPGALYGVDYRTLQRNAMIYVQATEVGGTHPAMIEAMASGGCVLALDTAENREVGGDSVGYFSLRPGETLSGAIREWLGDAPKREMMRKSARSRAAERYRWDQVTAAYENLLSELVR
ncbi:MAG: glycosyl transferase family 1 [Acidobacteria bacterium]|nr:MAG: glycosyl transferase family 1 [Acidobacteriota bacterium]